MKNSIILLFVLFLGLGACKKEGFVHQSEWLTPLLKTELGLTDLLADSNLSVNSDGTMELVVDYEEKMDSLAEILEVPDSLSEISLSLTQLVLEDRAFEDTITLVELYPPAVLIHGQTTSLEAQDINSNESTEIDVTEQFFTTATFQEGYLDLTIHNDLPVDVETIEFELQNKSDYSVILSGQFDDIAANGSLSKTFDLAGKTVEGVMLAKLKTVKTKASNGDVLINAYKGIRIEMLVRDLKPSEATAIFPAQNLIEQEEETTYNFGGPQITTMRLKEGKVLMEVYSSINEEIILEYEVPQSRHTETGEPLTRTFRIPAAQNGQPARVNEELEIGQYEISYKGKDVNAPPYVNTFYSILKARIEYTGKERSLSLSDSIYIKFGLVDIKPRLAIGDFGKRSYTFKDPLDVPLFRDLSGMISLEDAALDITFMNTFGIEATLDLDRLTGFNQRTNNGVNLLSPALDNTIFVGRGINAITEIRPYVTTVSLDKTNSNLKPFLENLPDRISPEFTIVTRPFGSNNLQDFAFDTSYLNTKLSLRVPVHFGMDSFTLVKKQALNWNTEDLDNVVEGDLRLTADNGYPWSARVKLEFLDEDDTVIYTLFGLDVDLIEAGKLDQAGEKVMEKTKSKLIGRLSASELQQVRQSNKVRITATFDTESGARKKIYSDYTIDLKLSSQFTYENK